MPNNDYIAQKYDQFDDFDELIGLMKTLNIVSFNRENWTRSFSTCSYNQKYYFCFHVIALSVNEGLTVIDNIHIKRALGQKAKPGRKSKANSALQMQ